MFKLFNRTCGVLAVAAVMLPAAFAQGTTTPIKYVVVIFGENISFDHYFGTYPNTLCPGAAPACNTGLPESPFVPLPNTPSINGLSPFLNGLNLVAPFRLDRSQALTCDNDNKYKDEQTAYNSGQVNGFALTAATGLDPNGNPCTVNLSMGYYDGNTVTALWNYVQYFAMSDNYFDTEFGVTEEGHQNLIAGQTHTTANANVSGKIVNGSIIANVEAFTTIASGAPAPR